MNCMIRAVAITTAVLAVSAANENDNARSCNAATLVDNGKQMKEASMSPPEAIATAVLTRIE